MILEIYNEAIYDLLGTDVTSEKKHEIKLVKRGQSIVSEVTGVNIGIILHIALYCIALYAHT